MKTLIFAIVLACSTPVLAQHTFDLKGASKFFDVKVVVAECDDLYCQGKATFSFFKKGSAVPYQVINHPDTLVQLSDEGKPLANVTLLYDAQSVVNVGDYNFDGMEDVALCDGSEGSYNGPSYRIYLSSRSAGKFVYNKALSDLAHHLGMFELDAKAKTLETFDKSGCCWHRTERYSVIRDRPVKIFEETEDATITKPANKVKITTKRLVKGRWKTTVKYVKREE